MPIHLLGLHSKFLNLLHDVQSTFFFFFLSSFFFFLGGGGDVTISSYDYLMEIKSCLCLNHSLLLFWLPCRWGETSSLPPFFSLVHIPSQSCVQLQYSQNAQTKFSYNQFANLVFSIQFTRKFGQNFIPNWLKLNLVRAFLFGCTVEDSQTQKTDHGWVQFISEFGISQRAKNHGIFQSSFGITTE